MTLMKIKMAGKLLNKLHILQPRRKNKFCLKCDYRLFNWYKICQHALAASVDIGLSFEYLTKVKKKVRQGKGSLTSTINTTIKLSEKGMEKDEVKERAKTSETSKPNEIYDKVAPQNPECNERQPTSLKQESLNRCHNIDQSQLSISTNTIDNMQDVNLDLNKKNQTSSLAIDRTNPPFDSHAIPQPSSPFSSAESKLNFYSPFFLQYVHLLYRLSYTKDLRCKYFHSHQFCI